MTINVDEHVQLASTAVWRHNLVSIKEYVCRCLTRTNVLTANVLTVIQDTAVQRNQNHVGHSSMATRKLGSSRYLIIMTIHTQYTVLLTIKWLGHLFSLLNTPTEVDIGLPFIRTIQKIKTLPRRKIIDYPG